MFSYFCPRKPEEDDIASVPTGFARVRLGKMYGPPLIQTSVVNSASKQPGRILYLLYHVPESVKSEDGGRNT